VRDTAGKSKDAIRRDNLSALLREAHLAGTVSRAALGETLGLSKTTIAELVSELETAGLVVRAGNEQKAAAGRPSQLVSPSKQPLVLVVNPEIDGINIAMVDFGAELSKVEFFEFDASYSLQTLIALVQNYLQEHRGFWQTRLRGVVVALPGAIDRINGKLIDAPSLGWRDLDVADELSRSLGLRVWATNNARAATVSEHLFGAAKGLQNAICLFSGVGGVGGGLIVNGRILEGSNGIAGEIGKMNLFAEGNRASQTFGSMMRREEIVLALGKNRLSDEALDVEILNTKEIAVNKVIDGQVAILSAAIETLRDLFDPDAVLLGGYLGSLVKSRMSQLMNDLNHESLKVRDQGFLIPRAAELKPMVLIGAAEAAWQELFTDPMRYKRKAKNA
jgi:predicted NBD/HSP70 family sugar kinase/biotin operon repressor